MAKAERQNAGNKTESFRERLGSGDVAVNDFKVDDLRKIASEYSISGSHDMHKEDLVEAINKARREEAKT